MKNRTHALVAVLATAVLSSCSLLTFDCGGPTTRETIAATTMLDDGDTLSVDGYASAYEERDRDGKYIHSLMISVQATNAVHYDTIPTALRPHVVGARLELRSGAVLYHVAMHDNSSQHNGASVLAAIPSHDVPQSVYDEIRRHLLANDLIFVVETDSAIRFAPARMSVQFSYDWRKSSGCQ